MIKLSRSRPAFDQIREGVKLQFPLLFDLRLERGGDKAASVAVAEWIAREVGAEVTLIEGEGVTDLRLSDYTLPAGLRAVSMDASDDPRGLDCHTVGSLSSLWFLSQHCNRLGIFGRMGHPVQARTDEILFCYLTDTDYNERRDMSGACARRTVDRLRQEGLNVGVLTFGGHEEFPDALHLSMSECVERIANASCVIAGDTGFSHTAGAFGTPLVSLYPDWRPIQGISDLTTAIEVAEWWGVPVYRYGKQFLPNIEDEKFELVEIGTDHEWSIEHVVKAVEKVKR